MEGKLCRLLLLLVAGMFSQVEAQTVHDCQDNPSGDFPCTNGNTGVPCSAWKDGTDDCGDMSDELHYCEADADTKKDDTDFMCTNGNTISCLYFQDGRNDCEDNSDEGYLYTCPTKTFDGRVLYQFKCTMEEASDWSDAACELIIFRLDNNTDCADDSDEQLNIGEECYGGEVPDTTCERFMPESFCNSSSQCECKSGRKVIDRGSDCALRVLGDVCETRADCWDARAGIVCDETHLNCTCEEGYNVDPSDTDYCLGNKIYEACERDTQCSTPVPNSLCTSGACVCEFVYLVDSTNTSCNVRVLGDICTADSQCQFGMRYSFCDADSNSTCGCQTGSFPNADNTDCTKRYVGDNCTQDSDCALIDNSECGSDNTCQCTSSDLYVDYLKDHCSHGLGDLYCDSDNNCTLHFDNSACSNNVCWCAPTYFEESFTQCERFVLGSDVTCASDDCTHIANAICEGGTQTCVCAEGFSSQDGDSCVSGAASTSCSSFSCQYPWAIALLVIGLLGIIVVVVILVIKRPWRKPEDEEKVGPTGSTIPYTNGGVSYDGEHGGKPVWTLRPKSGNPVMYDHMHLREPNDPDVDKFFSGGKKKRHGALPPLEKPGGKGGAPPVPGENGVFVFRGQDGSPRRAPTPSNVRDDGFHTCGFEMEDETKCQFKTDSYYRMRMHKKETSHFIRESWPNKKNKKRKPSLPKTKKLRPSRKLAPLEEEAVGQIWTDDEEDDPTLAALNGGPATARTDYDPPGDPSGPNGVGRHIALAFASIEEPMDTEDTANLLSDEEGDNMVHSLPRQDLPGGRLTPEPAGVMSPGDISVGDVQGSPAIAEVARANSQQGLETEREDGGQDSSSEDEDIEEVVGGGATPKPKSGKKKGGKKGAKKGGKKEKGEKGGKKGSKKGGKDGKDGGKKKKDGKKGGKSGGKKNKNNNNRNTEDEATDIEVIGEIGTTEAVATPARSASWIAQKLANQSAVAPTKSKGNTRVSAVHDWNSGSLELEPLDGDPLQYTRRDRADEDWRAANAPPGRPQSRCDMRSPVDTVVIPMPADRRMEQPQRQVAFKGHHTYHP